MAKLNQTRGVAIYIKTGTTYTLPVKFLDSNGAPADKSTYTASAKYWLDRDMSQLSTALTVDSTNDATGIYIIEFADTLATDTYYGRFEMTDAGGDSVVSFEFVAYVSHTHGDGATNDVTTKDKNIVIKTQDEAIIINHTGAIITAGGVADGNKGDITVSASGAQWDINNNSVTTSKIPAGAVVNANLADINQNIIKGRQAGAGVGPPQNLTEADVRSIINVEDGADVTDTTNVTAAGALMDSEVTNLAQVKAFDSSDYATAAQGATADSAQQPPVEGAFVNGDKTKLDSLVTNATHTGDVTGSTALTIADNVVTNAKLAQMATKTIKGNNTGITADPLDLTVTQILTLLLNKTDLPQETNPNRADDPMLIYDVSAALFKYILPVDITAKMPTKEITDPDLTAGNYDITIDERGHHLLVNCSTLCTIRVDLFANVAIPNNTQIFVTDLTGNGVQFGKVNTPITFTYNTTLYSLEAAGQLTPPIMMTWYDTDEILFQGGLAAA